MRFNRLTQRTLIAALAVLVAVISIGAVGYNQGYTALQVTQSLEDDRVFVKGSDASPEVTAVELRLDAPRASEQLTADVMLVVDRSASFPIEKAVDNAKRIIDRLGPNDRVGLVSFATEATLNAPLTPTSEGYKVKEALDDLVAEGKTAMGEGMAVATDELAFRGRANVEWVQILLTDGRTNFGRDPLAEAENARDEGVVIYAVGVGQSVNRQLLIEVSETTGGKFFTTYSDSIVDEILRVQVSSREPVIKNIEISERLSREIVYESASENGPNQVIRNADGTTTLRWFVNELFEEEAWTTRYTISSREVGIHRIHEDLSEIVYEDFRGRVFSTDLPVLNLEVRPKPPAVTASFSVNIEEPTTFDAIEFKDTSVVEHGDIIGWRWEFGDETTSTERNPIHRYRADGTYRVLLTVESDEGVEAFYSQNITVFTPSVSVRRTINTYLPVDETIPDQTFQVTLNIRINATINGLGIDENLPSVDASTWQVTSVENSTAEFLSKATENKNQWLFTEVLKPGDERVIIYDVTVPRVDSLGIQPNTLAKIFSITGSVNSASPPIADNNDIKGESQIRILRGFPIEVVIAHWDTAATTNTNQLDLKQFSTHKINQSQLDQARKLWRENLEVDYSQDSTGNKQKIDLAMMNRLTAYFLTQTSVFEELPSE